MASAAFELDPGTGTFGSTPQAVSSAGATVRCRLLSVSGVQPGKISWSIEGTNNSGVAEPAITLSGTPLGQIASFAVPAGTNKAYLVQCEVNDGPDVNGSATTRSSGKFYILNDAGRQPIAYGETTEGQSSHGLAHLIDAINNNDGSGAGVVAALSTALFVDAGTSVAAADQDGSIGAPYDDVQSAITGLDEVTNHSVWVAPGVYSGAVTLNSASDVCTISGPGLFYLGAFTVTDGTLRLFGGVITGLLTIASGKSASLYDAGLTESTQCTAGAGSLSLYRCDVTSTAMVLGNLTLAQDTVFTAVDTIDCSLSTSVTFRRCTFVGQTTLTFTGSAGSVTMDEYTLRSWIANGCLVSNGTLLYPGKTRTITGTTHTVEAADVGCTLYCTNAAGCTVTVPQASTLPVPPGSGSFVRAVGTQGQITWAGSGSMTVNSEDTLLSAEAWAVTQVEWLADNVTVMFGSIAP